MTHLTPGATFSPCRRYRYTLTRVWDDSLPVVVFCGLNPSTADETADDPTIRREVAFARAWGYGALVKVNAFAWRSTDPKALSAQRDPVGPDNLETIVDWARCADLFVAAWGTHIWRHLQDSLCLRLRQAGVKIHALQLTKNGFPSHPLYLPGGLSPRLWEGGMLR